jgi:hypothetical protein
MGIQHTNRGLLAKKEIVYFFESMNRVEFQRAKRHRDTLHERCDALQAMVGSLQLQLELYAEVMHGKHERTKVHKRHKQVSFGSSK